VVSRAKQACGLTLRASAPEDVRESIARTFSVDTRVDERSGRYSHELVKGEYRMVGQTVVVTITEKHWLLSWTVVDAQLRELVL
jgi:hypothetical protein